MILFNYLKNMKRIIVGENFMNRGCSKENRRLNALFLDVNRNCDQLILLIVHHVILISVLDIGMLMLILVRERVRVSQQLNRRCLHN